MQRGSKLTAAVLRGSLLGLVLLNELEKKKKGTSDDTAKFSDDIKGVVFFSEVKPSKDQKKFNHGLYP